jgi:guanylate kinase
MLYLYQVGGNILILGELFMGWSTKSKFLSVTSKEFVRTRLKNAGAEMEQAGKYKYQMINDDLDQAQYEVLGIFQRELADNEE